MTSEDIDQLAINTIRTLCMDAVQQANSGHPGTPMALAPVAYCLWQRREKVLPAGVKARVSVERASEFGWERYVGCTGCMIGMNTFGASAPLKELQTKFGFTPYRIVEAARQQLRLVRDLRQSSLK